MVVNARDQGAGLKQRNNHVAYPVQPPKDRMPPPVSAPDPLKELPPRLLAVMLMVAMCIVMVFYPAYTVGVTISFSSPPCTFILPFLLDAREQTKLKVCKIRA